MKMKRLVGACAIAVLVLGFANLAVAGLEDNGVGSGNGQWFYQNNPGDGWHDGGFAASLSYDGGNGWLAFSFDGSQPHQVEGVSNGLSYFDCFLKMDPAQDWSLYRGISFDVKVTSSGTMSDRDYARLYPRLDNNMAVPPDPDTLFDDDERVWQANNLDVTKNDTVWETFALNFDYVTDTGSYVDAGHYDIDNPYAGSYIQRDILESFRISTYLSNDRWIGSGETMTIYLDNVELMPIPVPGALLLGIVGVGIVGVVRHAKKKQ